MERMVKSAFDHVVMPESCTEQIEKTLAAGVRKPRHLRRTISAIAAACLFIVIVIRFNPSIVHALENTVTEIAAYFGFSDTATNSYTSNGGHFTVTQGRTLDGNNYATASYNTGSTPEWLSEVDGRLYFTGNGENIDLTDIISYDNAFTYIYTDSRGILHYIAIGGAYDPDPELNHIGWAEWMRKALEVETNPDAIYAGWIGGYGTNHWDNAADNYYGWYASALEILDIPWGRSRSR